MSGKNYRINLLNIINQARDIPCKDCGIRLPRECMEFDHRRGAKKFEVGRFRAAGVGKEQILREIEKCDVVCPNCHKIRHYREKYNKKQLSLI